MLAICVFALSGIAALAAEPLPLENPPAIQGWEVSVSSEARATDEAWTAVVHARRTPIVETASLGKPPVRSAEHALDGIASYYWEDQLTASGEAFDKRAMTAAHPTLPLGTKVRVTNLGNGQSAVLRINDRGPFVPGRIIDVSEAAADILGMRQTGLAPVRVDLVQNQ